MSAEFDGTVPESGPAGQRGAGRGPLISPWVARSRPIGVLGRAFAGVARRLAATVDTGRGERILAAMSDHRLRDLGLDRAALDRALHGANRAGCRTNGNQLPGFGKVG